MKMLSVSVLACCALLMGCDAFHLNKRPMRLRTLESRQHMLPDLHQSFHQLEPTIASFVGSLQNTFLVADEAVSMYSKVDKSGFIGFLATYIEQAIDFGQQVVGSYGVSIVMFTILVKLLTLPLTTTQLESTTKIQKLAPMQKKIQEKYADDEVTKNQMLAQLFQSAKVNPLAGCFPALVQIPVFISLYRALTNLVAENKIGEPFLWIPSLEGPVYSRSAAQAGEWITSVFKGNPLLGWHDTLAFLSLPLILFISQTISQKLLQPPRDPSRPMTDQEQFSQSLINNLPLIVAFFSINVPAGLSVYWIANNILTTIITTTIKNSLKDEQFPPEVATLMAKVDGSSSGAKKVQGSAAVRRELVTPSAARPKPQGFGKNSHMSSAENKANTVSDLGAEEAKAESSRNSTAGTADVNSGSIPVE